MKFKNKNGIGVNKDTEEKKSQILPMEIMNGNIITTEKEVIVRSKTVKKKSKTMENEDDEKIEKVNEDLLRSYWNKSLRELDAIYSNSLISLDRLREVSKEKMSKYKRLQLRKEIQKKKKLRDAIYGIIIKKKDDKELPDESFSHTLPVMYNDQQNKSKNPIIKYRNKVRSTEDTRYDLDRFIRRSSYLCKKRMSMDAFIDNSKKFTGKAYQKMINYCKATSSAVEKRTESVSGVMAAREIQRIYDLYVDVSKEILMFVNPFILMLNVLETSRKNQEKLESLRRAEETMFERRLEDLNESMQTGRCSNPEDSVMLNISKK